METYLRHVYNTVWQKTYVFATKLVIKKILK